MSKCTEPGYYRAVIDRWTPFTTTETDHNKAFHSVDLCPLKTITSRTYTHIKTRHQSRVSFPLRVHTEHSPRDYGTRSECQWPTSLLPQKFITGAVQTWFKILLIWSVFLHIFFFIWTSQLQLGWRRFHRITQAVESILEERTINKHNLADIKRTHNDVERKPIQPPTHKATARESKGCSFDSQIGRSHLKCPSCRALWLIFYRMSLTKSHARPTMGCDCFTGWPITLNKRNRDRSNRDLKARLFGE